MLRCVTPAGLVLALLLPGAATGQQIPSPYSFIETRHEAGALFGSLSVDRGQLELGPGGGPAFAGRYGIKMGSVFGFEATGLVLSTDRRVVDPQAEGGPEFLGTTNSLVAMVDGRLRFNPMGHRTWRGVHPFASSGIGLAMDVRRSSALEEDMDPQARFSFGPSFVGTLGGGLRWLPGERLAFRLEGSFHLWKVGTPRPFLELQEEIGPVPDQEWVSVGALFLGASIRF